MKFKIIKYLSLFLDNIVPEKYLSKLQEFLLSGAIFTDASKVLDGEVMPFIESYLRNK